MKPDDFESQLQRQPLQGPPQEWRAEILSAARAAAPEAPAAAPAKAPVSWWRELLWPCPQAWAGLATAWLVIAGLNWTTNRSSGGSVQARREVTPEERIAFMEQQRLLATLLEAQVTAPPSPPAEKAHPPRSDVDVERRRAYRRKDFGWT